MRIVSEDCIYLDEGENAPFKCPNCAIFFQPACTMPEYTCPLCNAVTKAEDVSVEWVRRDEQ